MTLTAEDVAKILAKTCETPLAYQIQQIEQAVSTMKQVQTARGDTTDAFARMWNSLPDHMHTKLQV